MTKTSGSAAARTTAAVLRRACRALVRDVRARLAEVADPVKAPAMQAYMKSAMPYLGVPVPAMRAACRDIFASHPLADFEEWRDTALALWRGASHREHRYAAIQLTGVRAARDFQTTRALPMYEEMIVTGAWWDYVDEIASHRLGAILRREPERMRRTMLAWARGDDLWKRRSAILCQLGFKAETDLDLLYACIEPSLGSKEFFLQKAIGWALRQHAWTDPAEVVRYVRANESRLAALSKREALKNVSTDGRGRSPGARSRRER